MLQGHRHNDSFASPLVAGSVVPRRGCLYHHILCKDGPNLLPQNTREMLDSHGHKIVAWQKETRRSEEATKTRE